MAGERNEPELPLPPNVGPVAFTQAQIQNRVAELGGAISRDYAGEDLVLVGILKGIVLFMADLLRATHIPVSVDFMAISRFGPPEESRGAARLLKDLDVPIKGRHVLLVEDIVDTGFTLSYLRRTLRARYPTSLDTCALLDRPKRRLIDVPLKYIGFEAPEEFLVGYGLHFREQYRQLPYIAYFHPENNP